MDEALRMNLSDGLSDGLDKQIIAGTAGLLLRVKSRKSQRDRRNHFRRLYFQFRIWPGGWSLRFDDWRFENRDGRDDLRARGQRLPQHFG